MLDTSNTPSPLNTTPRPDELTSVRKLPVMFGQVPNITGHFYSEMSGASGAFEYSGESSNNGSPNEPTSSSGKMNFNASLSNALYSGNDLQVSALQVLACIRI